MESSGDENSDRNLIVNYLPSSLNDIEFRRLFEPYGPIISSKIVVNQDGKSLCFGFIKYTYSESAEDAINNLNGIRIFNKVLKVGYALPQIPHSQRANNLIVKNLPKTVSTDELETLFNPYGKIVYSRILYEQTTLYINNQSNSSNTPRLSKGVAFVRYAKLMDAIHAMRTLHDTIPPGYQKPLEVTMIESSSRVKSPESIVLHEIRNGQGSSPGKNIIVRNLSPQIDEVSLCALFKPCGNVVWIKIARHRDGKSRQYGFVEMETMEGATRAIQHLNGCFFLGHKLTVKINSNINAPPFSVRCDKKFKTMDRLE